MSVRVVTGGDSPPQALAALTTHLHLRPRPPAAHAHRITCTTARDRPTGPDCPRRSPSRPPSIDGCRGTFHALPCIPTLPPQGPNSTSYPTSYHNPPPALRLYPDRGEAVKRSV